MNNKNPALRVSPRRRFLLVDTIEDIGLLRGVSFSRLSLESACAPRPASLFKP